MLNTAVIGMQWGDEGKGKIVDLLSARFDVVARFQGGHNAGHTVKFEDRHFSLHLVPSGILRPETRCVLGNGMVISPPAFLDEIAALERAGVAIEGRLFVSDRAHVIVPHHAVLDGAREEAAGGEAIGTTGRGIGPAYEAKMARTGLRICDLTGPGAAERMRTAVERLGAELEAAEVASREGVEELVERCQEWGGALGPHVADTGELLQRWIAEDRSILFEGAQGSLLDVDHGTYPYVTSSNASVGGVFTGTGVPPRHLDGVVGVVKAYTTRVGGGPFVTELQGETGEYLRQRGNEFGTTTGRPRRCGWLDLVALRYTVALNGADVLALTKLDVLDGFDEVRVCVAYEHEGERLERFPADVRVLEGATPVYETLPGWREGTVDAVDVADLPSGARDYVTHLEDRLETPVALISTGPRREETIVRDLPVLRELVGELPDPPA